MKDNCYKLLQSIGQLQPPQRQLESGEGKVYPHYDASENDYPDDLVFATSLNEIKEEKDLESQKRYGEIKVRRKYLWVINDGQLLMAWEGTVADNPRGFVCHTNITGGKDAIIGGELWFLSSGDGEFDIYLNFDSGRYKTVDADTQHPLAYELFECVGYRKINPLIL